VGAASFGVLRRVLPKPEQNNVIMLGPALRGVRPGRTYDWLMPSYDFPPDLLEASSTCKALSEQIAAFPLHDVTLTDGTPLPERRREARIYTVAMAEELAKLRAARLEKATYVVTHPFWKTVEPGDRWAARSALKHAEDTAAGQSSGGSVSATNDPMPISV
jgi:hypothetical protein